MLKHNQKAFWHFFLIYFGSVALLILASGFFYFNQQEKSLIKKEHFSMIEYTRELKMHLPPSNSLHISHTVTDKVIENFNMDNFKITEDYFIKYMPYSWKGGYLVVKKDKENYRIKLVQIKQNIIVVQVLLLLLFAGISYLLARRALRPMQDAITKLDKFSKDLIHDLNTPITSMLLNMKLLENRKEFHNYKELSRIKQSLQGIGELHDNLMLLLQENSMSVKNENISKVLQELVEIHQKIYTDIKIDLQTDDFFAIVNRNALKQVLSNILSNACKYNKKNGFVKIYVKERKIFIKDSGVGIENPNRIFERDYKEQKSGHGIGLDIVKRLCDAMEIDIEASSKVDEGTTISLHLRY